MKTYTAISGLTVYDVALLLYNDSRGTAIIIANNQGLLPDSTITAGTAINYDETVIYTKEVNAIIPSNPIRANYIVPEAQSVWDLAIQLYGTIDKLASIINVYSSDLNSQVTLGLSILPDYSTNYLINNIFAFQKVCTFKNGTVVTNYLQTDAGLTLTDDSGNPLIAI
jgi:hypothetical protein